MEYTPDRSRWLVVPALFPASPRKFFVYEEASMPDAARPKREVTTNGLVLFTAAISLSRETDKRFLTRPILSCVGLLRLLTTKYRIFMRNVNYQN